MAPPPKVAGRVPGEKGGARDAWAETRFRSGTSITSVVPWHAPGLGGWPSTLLGWRSKAEAGGWLPLPDHSGLQGGAAIASPFDARLLAR